MKKLLLTSVAALLMATSADAADWLYYPNARTYGCGSSWAICQYRANLRRNGEYTYRRTHNGNWSPAYQRAQQQIARTCTPATVWKDACR
jgi:opacity protein-like surface antigen